VSAPGELREDLAVPEVVTPAQVEAFRRDGFICVPNLLTDAELDRFAPFVDDAVARRKRNDQRSLAEKTLYERVGRYDAISAIVDEYLKGLRADPQFDQCLIRMGLLLAA
jgi:hypothetical protein